MQVQIAGLDYYVKTQHCHSFLSEYCYVLLKCPLKNEILVSQTSVYSSGMPTSGPRVIRPAVVEHVLQHKASLQQGPSGLINAVHLATLSIDAMDDSKSLHSSGPQPFQGRRPSSPSPVAVGACLIPVPSTFNSSHELPELVKLCNMAINLTSTSRSHTCSSQ